MDKPLEIAFHGLQGSPALEDDIRAHVAKLERHCKDLVSCRVTVEAGPGRSPPDDAADTVRRQRRERCTGGDEDGPLAGGRATRTQIRHELLPYFDR